MHGRRGTDGFRKLEMAQIEAERKTKETPLRKNKQHIFSCSIAYARNEVS